MRVQQDRRQIWGEYPTGFGTWNSEYGLQRNGPRSRNSVDAAAIENLLGYQVQLLTPWELALTT